jgi:hypothetical protein
MSWLDELKVGDVVEVKIFDSYIAKQLGYPMRFLAMVTRDTGNFVVAGRIWERNSGRYFGDSSVGRICSLDIIKKCYHDKR